MRTEFPCTETTVPPIPEIITTPETLTPVTKILDTPPACADVMYPSGLVEE